MRAMLIALPPAVMLCQAKTSTSTTATTSSAGKPVPHSISAKSVRFDFDFKFRLLLLFVAAMFLGVVRSIFPAECEFTVPLFCGRLFDIAVFPYPLRKPIRVT